MSTEKRDTVRDQFESDEQRGCGRCGFTGPRSLFEKKSHRMTCPACGSRDTHDA